MPTALSVRPGTRRSSAHVIPEFRMSDHSRSLIPSDIVYLAYPTGLLPALAFRVEAIQNPSTLHLRLLSLSVFFLLFG